MSHANISVFVPHLGCPHRCSFCDQTSITGTADVPYAEDIEKAVLEAKASTKYDAKNTELAFFGGSFTCIDREYMLSLLKAAYARIKNGDICGIRISTRPDGIDEEILGVLKEYGVTAIELGAQSMCDDVLRANFRGHTAEDVRKASALIKSHGFELGLQMMTGLFQSDREKDIDTAKAIIDINPKTVRIYPTVTLKNTYLSHSYIKGDYVPPTLDDTVDLCAELLIMFRKAQIKVIRLGLHSIDESSYVAGPWHPSLGELVASRIILQKATELLREREKGRYILKVNIKNVSKMTGQKRANLKALESKGYICRVVPSEDLSSEEIEILPERMN